MGKLVIEKKCSCGNTTKVNVDEAKYLYWCDGARIQDVFPDLHPMSRDVLITGFCYDCLSKMYNMPKPDEDWGNPVCHCPTCDCAIWEHRNKKSENLYVCPSCNTHMDDNGMEVE